MLNDPPPALNTDHRGLWDGPIRGETDSTTKYNQPRTHQLNPQSRPTKTIDRRITLTWADDLDGHDNIVIYNSMYRAYVYIYDAYISQTIRE